VKIDANRITAEGMVIEEEFSPGSLDLDIETEVARFLEPIRVRAEFSRITNAVTVHIQLDGSAQLTCSRCLKEFALKIIKDITLNYPVTREEHIIDLDPQIREEIILNYPLKPLCSEGCRGLCRKCGKNLNEGGCSCGTT